MKEKTMFQVALIWSLLGLFLILLYSQQAGPQLITINSALDNMERRIIIQGTVTKASYHDNVAFIDVRDATGNIAVVVFDKIAEEPKRGDDVKVTGKIKLYRGDLEIIADEITST